MALIGVNGLQETMTIIKKIGGKIKCSTKAEKEAFEKKHGVCVSCLLDLDYFDPVRMTPIDPMHNLFLGTAKHMISVWKTKLILNENDLLKIQEKIGNFFCPSDVCKLPQKKCTWNMISTV